MEDQDPAIRVLLAKIGVDVHDRGIKIIARSLRDAGMEVIYLGQGALPGQIARAAIDENVGIIGISSMEGMHHVRIPQLIQELKENKSKIPVICGGIIPSREAVTLREDFGVEVFVPGTPISTIVEAFKRIARRGESERL